MCGWLVTEFMLARRVTGAAECPCKVSTPRSSVGCDIGSSVLVLNLLSKEPEKLQTDAPGATLNILAPSSTLDQCLARHAGEAAANAAGFRGGQGGCAADRGADAEAACAGRGAG